MSEVFNQYVLEAINRAVQDGVSTTALEVDGIPQYCIINAETREIEIPGELNIFGVESDEKSTRVYFRCPKYVGTNVDLDMTQCMVYVPYRNANGEKDQYIVTDLNETEDGENVEFTWLISRKASAYMGITEFGIRAIKTATGGTIEAEWNTTVASANVIRGMDVGLLEFSEENKDALAQAMDLVKQELEQTKSEITSEIETKGQQTLDTIPDDYTTAAQNALSAKTEVEDIRVGADGKTYESAGEAVRSQSGFMSEQVTSITAINSDNEPQIQSFGDIPINKGALLWRLKYETFTDVDENTKQIINRYSYLWFMPKLTLMVEKYQTSFVTVKTIKDAIFTNVVPIIAFADPLQILIFEYVKDSSNNYLKYRTSVFFESDKQLKTQDRYADAKAVGDSIQGIQDSIQGIQDNRVLRTNVAIQEVCGQNLIDINARIRGYLAYSSVPKVPHFVSDAHTSNYYASQLIPLKQGIRFYVSNVIGYSPGLATATLYDERFNIVGGIPNLSEQEEIAATVNTIVTYIPKENEKYIRFYWIDTNNSSYIRQVFATYDDIDILPDNTTYTPYKPITDRIENLESLIGSHETPVDLPLIGDTSPVYYTVSEDADDNVFGVSLFMDAYINAQYNTLFGEDERNVGFHKEMKKRYIIPQVPADEFESSKEETEETLPVYTVGFNKIAPIVQKYRGVKINKSIYPKILIIGDSVGDGYGANINKIISDGPSSYDTWTDYFFRINGQKCKTLNIGFINGNNYGSVKSYKLSEETIRAGSISKGGWSLEDLNLEYFEQTSNKNPFYNPSTQKFSLKYAVDHFKTLSDDGETRLIVGETAGDMVTDADTFDFCTPTHVVISLTHNTSLSEYQNNIAGVISTIRSEYPNIKIILMVMDESATFFIDDYKNYAKDSVYTPGNLHTKNISIYQYIKENIENESNNVFLLSANLIQPTAEGFPTKVLPYAYNLTSDEKMHVKTNEVGGPSYHPNNLTHASFGYQIYSIVQWTMS